MHTTRCQHATGSMEAYVQSAIERGLRAIGFADHSPFAARIPAILDEAHAMMFDEPQKRLSQS